MDAELNRRVADGAVRVAGDQTSGIPWLRLLPHRRGDLRRFALAAAHPDLATWTDIGDSWAKEQGEGGYDIFALRLTNRAIPGPKPKFVLMAAIHAREYTTAELATRFAERLIAGYWTDPDITWLLDYHELHVIPQINPDGRKRAEAGVLWRKNVNSEATAFCPASSYGIDLNRNSSFQWNQCDGFGCSSGYACDLTYRGPSAASEPETNVIQDYLAAQFLHPPARPLTRSLADTDGLFISLHSYSELVLFPWGWTGQASPNFTALQTLGRKFGYFTGYEVCQAGSSGCLYQTDGTTDDWSYGTLGVASYTFELGTWFFESCTFFENSILEQSMDALMYAFKAVRRPYLTPAGPEVVHLSVDDTNRRRRHARATERRGRRHPL
ncbi:MAG: M14 family zinc carboxypeptidase [Caldilineaceae bacterium]